MIGFKKVLTPYQWFTLIMLHYKKYTVLCESMGGLKTKIKADFHANSVIIIFSSALCGYKIKTNSLISCVIYAITYEMRGGGNCLPTLLLYST